MHKEHHGLLFGLVAAVASTASALLIKWTGEVPNETIVFARFFVAFLVVLPGILKGRVKIEWKKIRSHFIRGLAGLGSIYCLFYSIEKLPLVIAITISNTTPLIVPVVIFFWMRYVLPKARLWSVLIGFVGVLIILRPQGDLAEMPLLVGVLGSVLASIALVGVRLLSRTESAETILTYYFLIGVSVSFLPMLYTWAPIEKGIDWLNLLGISLFSLAFQFCFTKALTHAPASKVSSLSYLSVIFSGILGWWVWKEVPDFWVLLGAALIVGGGLLAFASRQSPRKR
jgi:drug/metabolite transporter (DMT)-like permease